jgi:hypothetical protein
MPIPRQVACPLVKSVNIFLPVPAESKAETEHSCGHDTACPLNSPLHDYSGPLLENIQAADTGFFLLNQLIIRKK